MEQPKRRPRAWRHAVCVHRAVLYVFALTGLFPLVYTGWVALHDWHLIGGQQGFVGLENFALVLNNQRFG